MRKLRRNIAKVEGLKMRLILRSDLKLRDFLFRFKNKVSLVLGKVRILLVKLMKGRNTGMLVPITSVVIKTLREKSFLE